MEKNFFCVLDFTDIYITNNPKLEGRKQVRRKVLMEQMDEYFNLTGNTFLCIMTDRSALEDIKKGDIIEAHLNFDVGENFDQLEYAEIKVGNERKSGKITDFEAYRN